MVAFSNVAKATNKTSRLIAVRKISRVYFENRAEHANTLRGQNTDFLHITAV
jgi:hypothetical protein